VTDDGDYILFYTRVQHTKNLKAQERIIHINVTRGNINNAVLSSTERGCVCTSY